MQTQRDYEDLLPKLLNAIFSSESDRSQAEEILAQYGHNEQDRVRVGILRVSNGEFEKMRSMVNLANTDYRDLLVAAEYGRSFDKDQIRKSNPGKYRELQELEAREYDDWISSILGS